MDKDTIKNKEWLDKRFAEGVKEGKYFAHQPIYGYKKGRTEGRDLIRYLRTLSILVKLSHFKFNSFIDIGGAEGYTANLVKKAFNIDSYTCDLSFEANLRARELFGIDSAAVDISNLPFKDEAFDAVLCSEVLEHIANPVQAIYELKRITKKVLVITTEAICYDKLERKLQMIMVDLNVPHSDRNWFLADDFIFILGKNTACESTIYSAGAIGKNASPGRVREILAGYTERPVFTREGIGATILFSKAEKSEGPKILNQNLADLLLSVKVNANYEENKHDRQVYLNSKLINLLQCPKCSGATAIEGSDLRCKSCNNKYIIKNGVPLMYTCSSDMDYLSKKWAKRYSDEFGRENKDLIKLIKTFKCSNIRTNFLAKAAAWRILKIKKFIHNVAKKAREMPISSMPAYFSKAIKNKILREIRRIVNRIRKPRLSDFKFGDIVEFARDYRALGNEKVLVRQGAFGKVADISGDSITIKVDGIEDLICLWADSRNAKRPTTSYIKQVNNQYSASPFTSQASGRASQE